MKICLVCTKSLRLECFAPLPKGRNGLHPWCKACVSTYNASRYANRPTGRQPRKSATFILPYTPIPKNKVAEAAATPGYKTAATLWRKLHAKGRIPKWLTVEDVLPFYALAQKFGLTVDHIVPLNGKDVSGLHVPWNMQLLTRSDNARKGNLT